MLTAFRGCGGCVAREETDLTVLEAWEEAVRVEKDVTIDLALFSPPPDVTFEPASLPITQRENDHKLIPWMRLGPELGYLF